MSVYRRHSSSLRLRIIMSVVMYVGFVVSSFLMGPLQAAPSQHRLGVTLLLLLGAVLLLPRSALPSRGVRPKSAEEADTIQLERSDLRRMEVLAMWMRLSYLAGALLLFFVVPRLFHT